MIILMMKYDYCMGVIIIIKCTLLQFHKHFDYFLFNHSVFFFKGNIAVGGSCEHNKQCTGTADANICRSRKCACQTGYILIENNCYEGKILTQTSWIYY